MKVYLATDHSGIEIKNVVKTFLVKKGYDVVDCGAEEFNKDDDYPDFIDKAAKGVAQNPEQDKGIIFGGSGQGEAMAANKTAGIRCAVFYTPALPVTSVDATGRQSEDPFEIIKLTREHNNANILSLSARFLQQADVLEAVQLFLSTPFPGEERHTRRIEKIKAIENNF